MIELSSPEPSLKIHRTNSVTLLWPKVDGGRFPIKRVVGEEVCVQANIYADGHDTVRAVLLYRIVGKKKWEEAFMDAHENDKWTGMPCE